MGVTTKKFLKQIQERVATGAITTSAARGSGASGVIAAAQRFVCKLDLSLFQVGSDSEFQDALDNTTRTLKSRLPNGARHWGRARKLLNLFLRDCAYNAFLRRAYRLGKIEQFLEIPLDSYVIRGLQHRLKTEIRNFTINGLETKDSQRYQLLAQQFADDEDTYRVHLDNDFWLEERARRKKKEKRNKGKSRRRKNKKHD